MDTPCYYPSYENEDPNEFVVGRHKWGKDGFCIICGEQDPLTCPDVTWEELGKGFIEQEPEDE